MTEKLKKFLFSDEFFELVDKLDEILNIDPNQDFERDSKIVIFLDSYFREKLAGENLINYLKTNFDWLSEEELNKFLDFIQENLFQKREELWKKEIQKEESEIVIEEPLEEREKRYLELMKKIIKSPQKEKSIDEIIPQKTHEEISKKTIVLESKEEKSEEKPIIIKSEEKERNKIELPEETIIIKKYKKEKNENENETIDLSKI